MRTLFGLLGLGVVAVMWKDAVAKNSQAPKVINSTFTGVSDFYKAI